MNSLNMHSLVAIVLIIQVITAKIVNSNVSETSMNSSDNSTDSSDGSPTAHLEGPNLDSERVLPSVVSAVHQSLS